MIALTERGGARNETKRHHFRMKPKLDPTFSAAILWNRAYREQANACGSTHKATFALLRPDESCSIHTTPILPLLPQHEEKTTRYLERMLKFLLWQRGASRVLIHGCDTITRKLAALYSATGARSFDFDFFGEKIYGTPMHICCCEEQDLPEPHEGTLPLGRHLDGCRIGFDLGGSDRKCAALIDGEVVFAEEVEWDPYFQTDPNYHINGINDSLKRAAAHLPRIDAIGGSAAGVYVNNEVRVASLFRGIPKAAFETSIRRIFFDLKERWNNVPFEVVNDGEVTALAGSMSMGRNAVLGLSMGTSQAVGYVTPEGNITPWLNELAFAPVDYQENAPSDEWSGDCGCGVQYLSQQAVALLASAAGMNLPETRPFAERLVRVQELMHRGDARAAEIYATIGSYLGYAIAHYADFYEIESILLLGRVTSGDGGNLIIQTAKKTLQQVFPELSSRIDIRTPGEQDKRLGQAVAAASLPFIGA
jgi:predicted NBD/HSP70 family sugar kinase